MAESKGNNLLYYLLTINLICIYETNAYDDKSTACNRDCFLLHKIVLSDRNI